MSWGLESCSSFRRGVEHYPRCDEEVHLLLIEPTGIPTPVMLGVSARRAWELNEEAMEDGSERILSTFAERSWCGRPGP